MCGRGAFLIYALSLRLPCNMNKIKKKKKKKKEKHAEVHLVDNDLGPCLLLAHGRDVLVKLSNLCLNCGNVWCELFLRKSVQGCEGEVSSLVPLDARDEEVCWGFVVVEDVVDCVSHVVDVRLCVDLFAVSVDHNGSFSFLGGSSDFLFLLVSLPRNFGPGSRV